ncbi:dephospho-CoA kinase [Ruicaihuangia caeni]|uniref:Dephospho-CoA kinase n=1 Tax=Ruicaihuangia caeni TaxID=3042517 RepID=A0AAW6T2Y0_9MICO|nr:dephospho-CoA kinase [Klugiella sp. YN-L-19]MDI2098122.1 dephospho-CoA kinase [Klugiella sp. YN-L-19]
MLLIGLTGGIASGKSLVADRLESLGAVHIDADVIARQVVEPGTPALEAIRQAFGEGVLRPDGSLDRPALGALVFGDRQRLDRLNAIVHPAVKQRVAERIAEASDADPDAVVVYNVPLLVEAGRAHELPFDHIVVVDAPAALRLQRMVEHRGLSRDDAERRIASQASDADRLAAADIVIRNDGPVARTLEQVDALWARLKHETAAADSTSRSG